MKLIMVLAMISQIFFPANDRREGFMFNKINFCKTEQSWKMLTNKAELKLSRALYFGNGKVLSNMIKKGDEIKIYLGYNGELNKEFEGFVSDITTDAPVVIYCEDAMWKLKQEPVNKSYKAVKLEKLLKDIVPSPYTINAVDIDLGSVRFEKMTVAQVLQKLKDKYGLYSYFKGKTLYCGNIYLDDAKTVKYGFEDNIISHDLKYVTKDDLKIKVTAQSIQTDGSSLSVFVGDINGQESKLIYSNIKSEATLKKLAEEDLDKLKVDGYKGSIVTFGIPYVEHGYNAEIDSKQYPERKGTFHIDTVTKEFSDSATFRIKAEIGKRV